MAVAQQTEKKAFFQREIELGNAFGDKPKEHFYNEFASLIESGIDMRRAIRLIIDEQEKKRIKAILEELETRIIGGASLSEAMEISGKFSAYEYQSIRIGEETGRLRHVLVSLAAYFGDKVKLKRQLVSVFTYPGFVMLITIGVLYFMLNSVVPMFEDVFKQFDQELPWLTQRIVWLSAHFSTFMIYFLGIVTAASAYFYSQRKEEWFRRGSAAFMLRLPVFGPLMRKIYLARFCQSMALLMESRTPLVRALELVEEMIRFYPLEEALARARREIMAGNQLHAGLSHFSIVDKRLISLIRIAEEINQLDHTFARLARQYNEEVEYRTKLMGTIIEPAIIVVIGAVVGLIMVAMYLPMFNLSNVIK
jgi:type IV pilus assembly protein PilC